MISVLEALDKVKTHSKSNTKSETRLLNNAMGCILFGDIVSPIYMPPFRQSAMDGYAIALHDKKEYTLTGEVKAGDDYHPILKPGEAIRIFTGAAVPDTANAVIMQEKTTVTNNTLILDEKGVLNENIRPKGEQVEKGEIALPKGTVITPAVIGYLASLGITEIEVYKKPNISVITTGNELTPPGKPLTYGKIYESNSAMLIAALSSLGYNEFCVYTVEDEFNQTLETIKHAIASSDLVLLTGGISVGDYDFVGTALNELKVSEIFYKVKQKPGKPLYFGKNNDTLIFALPGNPAAALTCFYHYVYPSLQWISGNKNFELNQIQAKAANSFKKKGDRAQFLKASLKHNTVTLLEGQSSAMLQTYALANALVYVPEECHTINENDLVTVLPLP